MSWDIYGDRLARGHCEVHPWINVNYPCHICLEERRQQQPIRKENNMPDRRENADGEIQKLVREAVNEGRMIQLEALLYSNAQEPMTKVEIIELMRAQLAQLKREGKE